MPRERGATQVVQMLVRRKRTRVVVVIQLLVVLSAGAIVWGVLDGLGFRELAYYILGGLGGIELLLLIFFLRQPIAGDDTGVLPIAENAEELVLSMPGSGLIVLDRRRGRLRSSDGKVNLAVSEIRFMQVEEDDGVRLLAATQRDLVVLCEVQSATRSDRADMKRLGKRLARSAAVPFEE